MRRTPDLGESSITEDSAENHGVWVYAQADIQPALEACCRENLHFIYLLEGQRAPDHNTINRFRKNILTQEAGQDILCQLVVLLHERGLLSLEAAFIDGTRLKQMRTSTVLSGRKQRPKRQKSC